MYDIQHEGIIEHVADALMVGAGRVGDHGLPEQPWMYCDLVTPSAARAALEEFGVGRIKPLADGRWRYYCTGNDALIVAEILHPLLWGKPAAQAARVLQKWGDDGRPWPSKEALIAAHGEHRYLAENHAVGE